MSKVVLSIRMIIIFSLWYGNDYLLAITVSTEKSLLYFFPARAGGYYSTLLTLSGAVFIVLLLISMLSLAKVIKESKNTKSGGKLR